MGVLAWIILGLIAGALAKLILPGRDPGGFIGTTVIGIAGAFIGGRLSAKLFDRPIDKHFFDLPTWGAAIAASLVLLIAYRILFGNHRDRPRQPQTANRARGASAHPSRAARKST